MSLWRATPYRLRDSLSELKRRFESCDPIDVGARMVFALFLLSTWVTGDLWYFKFPLRALAMAALVLPPLHRGWGRLRSDDRCRPAGLVAFRLMTGWVSPTRAAPPDSNQTVSHKRGASDMSGV